MQSIPGVARLPANTNPASWMLDVLYKTVDPDAPSDASSPPSPPPPVASSRSLKNVSEHSHDTPPRFAQLWQASKQAAQAVSEATAALDPANFDGSRAGQSSSAAHYGANFFVQVSGSAPQAHHCRSISFSFFPGPYAGFIPCAAPMARADSTPGLLLHPLCRCNVSLSVFWLDLVSGCRRAY